MAFFKKINPPQLANIIIFLALISTVMGSRSFLSSREIICWDVISYYAYVPATFVQHDLTLNFMDENPKKHDNHYWPSYMADSTKYIKTSMGMAFLYTPFFFIGHIATHLAHEEPSGYSLPYRQALVFGSLIYLAFALFFLRKLLEKYFSPKITAIVLLLTVTATNLMYYSTYECTMPHLYNFMLITMFAWFTIQWHEKPGVKYSIILGLLLGLISLIRPTNLVIVAFFIFWNVFSIKSFKEKVSIFLNKYYFLLLIALFAFIVWIPQLIYWKMITGHWLFFPYGEERFYFNHPKIISGLFSYRKGWLLYTPIMIFALAGIPFLLKKNREFFVPVLLYTIFSVYVIFSWWCWWYGGSLGCRPIIDSYGILAIPMAAFFTWLAGQKRFLKTIVIVLVAVSLLLNIKYQIQKRQGTLHYDSMSKEVYWNCFFLFNPNGQYWKILDPPDYSRALQGLPETIEKK